MIFINCINELKDGITMRRAGYIAILMSVTLGRMLVLASLKQWEVLLLQLPLLLSLNL